MVLLADAYGCANEPEAQVTLVDDSVPVAEAVTTDVAVGDGVRGPTVAGWGGKGGISN